MADEADQADVLQQQYLDEALAKRATSRSIKPKNLCHNCDEPLNDDRLFCDIDCRDDYSYREQRDGSNLS